MEEAVYACKSGGDGDPVHSLDETVSPFIVLEGTTEVAMVFSLIS
jgi:hypothetical protein